MQYTPGPLEDESDGARYALFLLAVVLLFAYILTHA